jgi:hypothetical protein
MTKTILIVIVTAFACVTKGDNGGAVATAILSVVRREAGGIAASSSLAKTTAFITTSSPIRPWLTQRQKHRRRRSRVELGGVGVSNRARGYDAAIDISELAPRDIPSFENWAYEYGIHVPRDMYCQVMIMMGWEY